MGKFDRDKLKPVKGRCTSTIFSLANGHFTAFMRVVQYTIIVHGCFTAATVRHEPSRIVAVRANLATRLGSSRSVFQG